MDLIKPYFTFRNVFLLGLLLEVFGLPLFRGVISVGQFVMLGGWILELDFKRKWHVMKTSKLLWVLSSFFILHLIGLLWTSDFEYAANDIRVKLPLLWFPLLFITTKHKLSSKEINTLLWVFTLSVFAASIACTMVWLGYTKHKVIDIRDISIFHSHIRFALMIDLVICFLLYDFFKTGKLLLYLLKISLVAWLIVFLGIMQSFTGIVILGVVVAYYFLNGFINKNKGFLKFLPLIILAVIGGWFIYFVKGEFKNNLQRNPIDISKLENITPNGNHYFHDTSQYRQRENGNYVNVYVCPDEMRKEWNTKSKIPFDSNDYKGNQLPITLTRYLASKGLRKDSMGVAALNKDDIKNIELGVTNYKYASGGVKARLYQFFQEYEAFQDGRSFSGHSIIMRLEFFKTGLSIFNKNKLIGVGTGDVQLAYNKEYELLNSNLSLEWRKRSHNQFLEVMVGLGLIGLLSFLLFLFYPVLKTKHKHYLFSSFFLISLLSMINEDTLETQAGVTFFGFFYCFLLFYQGDNKLEIKERGD